MNLDTILKKFNSWLLQPPKLDGLISLLGEYRHYYMLYATGILAKPFNETGVKGAGSSLAKAEDFIGLAGSSRSLLKLSKSPTKRVVTEKKVK